MSHTTILTIGNALPHADAEGSARILALWHAIAGYFAELDFSAKAHHGGEVRSYRVSLDATDLVRLMQHAIREHGSFDGHRAAHAANPAVSVAAKLDISVTDGAGTLDDFAVIEVATVFLQQVALAANLAVPGSFQVLSASFGGAKGYLVEPCLADTLILGHARTLLPLLGSMPAIDFDAAWRWLESCAISHSFTAIKDVDKVLLTLLKVAEQRQEHSARAVLLVLYQLEMLLDCHTRNDLALLRRRLRMALGIVPEELDCLGELYSVRSQLLTGSQPVRRPALLRHGGREELDQELGRHNNAVVAATTLVLALLGKLVRADAQRFAFSENLVIE